MKVQDIIVSIATLALCGVTVFRAVKYGSSDIMIVYLLCGLALWQTIVVPLIFNTK